MAENYTARIGWEIKNNKNKLRHVIVSFFVLIFSFNFRNHFRVYTFFSYHGA